MLGKGFIVSCDVISSNIPLLLSKEALKQCDAVLDFSNDTARIFAIQVSLSVTANGHYMIPLEQSKTKTRETIQEALFCKKFERANDAEHLQIAKKIHKQFDHPKSHKLKSLCSDAGVVDKKFLNMFDTIEDECDICIRYKKAPLRPIVGFTLAREFNHVVAIDLKQWSHTPTIWFCHMTDLATQYSVCIVVKKKDSKTILHAFLTSWISISGCPCQFLSDNGREFNNDEFRSMADSLNIRVCTTAAESPWFNGCNERYNGILGGMVKKNLEDADCTLDMALAWAVSAKNSLENYHRFSPNQLVFRRNPNFPSCITNKPPALEEFSDRDIVRCTLSAIHKARQVFIQKESCEKLRRSILQNIRPTGEKVSTGDLVFYRRSGDNKWHGPGTVIGRENKQILVKHGGVYYRCHACHILKDNSSRGVSIESEESPNNSESHNQVTGNDEMRTQASFSQCNLDKSKEVRSSVGLDDFSDTDDDDPLVHSEEDRGTGDFQQQTSQEEDCSIDDNTSGPEENRDSLTHGNKDENLVIKSKPILPIAK